MGFVAKNEGTMGLIQPDSGAAMLLVLPASCTGFGGQIPPVGIRVEYDAGADPERQEPCALNVWPPGMRRRAARPRATSGRAADVRTGIVKRNFVKYGYLVRDDGEPDIFLLPAQCIWPTVCCLLVVGFDRAIPPEGTRVQFLEGVDPIKGQPLAEAACSLPELLTGTVVVNKEGFGFIAPDGDAEAKMLFVLPQFCYAFQRKIPPPGTRVQYELGVDPKKGEPLAKNVQPTGEPPVELSAKGTRAWGADWDGGAWDWAQDQDWGEDSGGDWGSAPAPPTMRAPPAADPDGVRTGTISRSVAKFGYVAQDSGEPDLFVLPAACKGFELAIPPPGTRVAYRRGRDPKGMPVAQDVRPEADVRPAKALRGMIGRNRISTSSATSCGTAGRPTSSCSPGSAQPSAAASRRWARASPSPSGRARGSPRRRTSAPRRPRSPRPPRGPGRAGGRGPARRGGARRARPRRRRGGKDLGGGREGGPGWGIRRGGGGHRDAEQGQVWLHHTGHRGEPDLFVLPGACCGGEVPPVGTRVAYTIGANAKTGQPLAQGVRPEGEPGPGAAAGAGAGEASGVVSQNKGTFGFITQETRASRASSSCCRAPAPTGRSPPWAPAWSTPWAPTRRRGSPWPEACAQRASPRRRGGGGSGKRPEATTASPTAAAPRRRRSPSGPGACEAQDSLLRPSGLRGGFCAGGAGKRCWCLDVPPNTRLVFAVGRTLPCCFLLPLQFGALGHHLPLP
ncbi:unnamed protein product, partial [Prorocentrum cordatum]